MCVVYIDVSSLFKHTHTHKRQRKREGARECASVCWFSPQIPATTGAELGTRAGDTLSGFPHGWQGPSYLNRHLLSLRVHVCRKLELGAKAGL